MTEPHKPKQQPGGPLPMGPASSSQQSPPGQPAPQRPAAPAPQQPAPQQFPPPGSPQPQAHSYAQPLPGQMQPAPTYAQQRPQAPNPADASSGGGSRVAMICMAICGGVLLLVCSGAGGGMWYAWSSALSGARTVARDGFHNTNESGFNSFKPQAIAHQLANKPIESTREALVALDSSDRQRKQNGARYLQRQPIDSGLRPKVAGKLAALVSDPDSWTSKEAMKALDKWGTATEAPAVATALAAEQVDAKLAIDYLGRFKYAPGVGAIVGHLESPFDEGKKAEEALIAIGKPAQAEVQAALAGGKRRTEERARRILASYGVNPDEALLSSYIAQLKGTDDTLKRSATGKLAAMQLVLARQGEVARALDAALASTSGFAKRDIVKALVVWADEGSVPGLISVAKSDRSLESDALKTLERLKDPRAAEIWAAKLGDFSRGDAAANALIDLGAPAEPYVLAQFNAADQRTRDKARIVLDKLASTESKLLAQSMKDIVAIEDGRRAAAALWLADATIDETKRPIVAPELAKQYKSARFTDKKAYAKGLARWATKNEAGELITMLDDREQEVWQPALESVIKFVGDKQTALGIATALAKRFESLLYRAKPPPSALVLKDRGPAAQPIALVLIRHSNPQVVFWASKVLYAVGDEDALTPIRTVKEAWVKARRKETSVVVKELDFARNAIRKRTASGATP